MLTIGTEFRGPGEAYEGSPETQILRYVGKAVGVAHIALHYSRPASATPDDKVLTFTINVVLDPSTTTTTAPPRHQRARHQRHHGPQDHHHQAEVDDDHEAEDDHHDLQADDHHHLTRLKAPPPGMREAGPSDGSGGGAVLLGVTPAVVVAVGILVGGVELEPGCHALVELERAHGEVDGRPDRAGEREEEERHRDGRHHRDRADQPTSAESGT